MKKTKALSKDHQMEREGVTWSDSAATEDFSPHLPKEEFDRRTAAAKRMLAKHGLDAMILFSYDNKYYYGGYRESNIRYSHRWRHCLIISQEHDPVFVGENVLSNSVRRTTWIRDIRAWSQIKIWRLLLRFIDVFLDTIKSLGLDNKVIGMEYGPEYVLEVSVDEIREILAAGADKISINSSAVRRPELIGEGAKRFGSQCIVVAIDARRLPAAPGEPAHWEVYINGGRVPVGRDAVAWAREAADRGAGELLVTSMDADGTRAGYDVELLRAVSDAVRIPVIASGGAGRPEHFYEALTEGGASAALAASLFHYREISIAEIKAYLAGRGVEVRL